MRTRSQGPSTDHPHLHLRVRLPSGAEVSPTISPSAEPALFLDPSHHHFSSDCSLLGASLVSGGLAGSPSAKAVGVPISCRQIMPAATALATRSSVLLSSRMRNTCRRTARVPPLPHRLQPASDDGDVTCDDNEVEVDAVNALAGAAVRHVSRLSTHGYLLTIAKTAWIVATQASACARNSAIQTMLWVPGAASATVSCSMLHSVSLFGPSILLTKVV